MNYCKYWIRFGSCLRPQDQLCLRSLETPRRLQVPVQLTCVVRPLKHASRYFARFPPKTANNASDPIAASSCRCNLALRHPVCLPVPVTDLLHLADNLAGATERLDHLLALLPSPNGVVTLLEQIVKLGCAVHLVEEFALHIFLGVSRSWC